MGELGLVASPGSLAITLDGLIIQMTCDEFFTCFPQANGSQAYHLRR